MSKLAIWGGKSSYGDRLRVDSPLVTFQSTVYHTIAQDLAQAGAVNQVVIGPALMKQLQEQSCGVQLDDLHAQGYCLVLSAELKVKRNSLSSQIVDVRLLVPRRGEKEDAKVLASAKSLAFSKVDTEFWTPSSCEAVRATTPAGQSRPVRPDLTQSTDLYDGGAGAFTRSLFRPVAPELFRKGDTVHVVEPGLAAGDELDESHEFWSRSGFLASMEALTTVRPPPVIPALHHTLRRILLPTPSPGVQR